MRFDVARFVAAISMAVSGPFFAQAQSPGHGVAGANIHVIQNDSGNTTNSVAVTTPVSFNQFQIRAGSNKGDYNVQIGPNAADDVNTGVIISSAAENGRNNSDASYPGINYCTTALNYHRSGESAGAYYIPVFNAPSGAEFNINIAAAFFSYTNWLAGLARNTSGTDGGPNNLFTGSPGLSLGSHFVDNGAGISTVNLTSLGIDSQTSGVLLVGHGENEDNYALSQVNSDGTWTVFVKDNGSDSNATEQDPVSFVFIPKTNTTVVSGRFRGDGEILMFSGATPQFAITNTSAGNWRLTIPGYSPANGVLILSPEGGSSINQDNIVSYEADGDGWIIQSRDLPGLGLQTPGTQPVSSFVFIPAPATMNLVAPQDQGQNQRTAPVLQVSVSNALTVEFYGRAKPASSPSDDFTIAILPDTQYYTSERNGGKKEMFVAQAEWIITNRVAQNIVYVAHLGDISDQGDIKSGVANTTEWRNSTNAMYRLENPTRTLLPDGIPYGVAVGNHDSEPNGDPNGTTLFYNQYFGVPHFDGRDYYAGHYGGNNDNHFDFFSAGGMDFVVLYFEFDPNANPAVLAWGNEVLNTNRNRRAIIVTHSFGNTQTPLSFSAQGAAIYNALKHNTNIFMMLAGHVTGEGSRSDTFNGNTIRTYVQDFQGWTNGGNGFMRTMTFSPANDQVVVQTFSPWTGEYETDSNSEFFFPYEMPLVGDTNAASFSLLGVSSNITSGIASNTWKGLQHNTAYEWYAIATDAFGNVTTSPVWTFATGPNVAPTAGPSLVAVMGDASTNVTLAASDANGDELMFQIKNVFLNGQISNFNTNSGALTYFPVHGFRGYNSISYNVSDGFATSGVTTLGLYVVDPPDTNSNDIPDSWETNYGVVDPSADADGDGQSNLQEYFANTNPTNAASFLRIDDASRSATGHVTLMWPSVGGSRYRVQYSEAASNGSFNGVFTDIVRPLDLELDTAPYGSSSTQTFVDDFSASGGSQTNKARYYRIKIVQ